MKPDELEKIISEAFENKQNISENSDKKILDAIKETIELTDKGLEFLSGFSGDPDFFILPDIGYRFICTSSGDIKIEI